MDNSTKQRVFKGLFERLETRKKVLTLWLNGRFSKYHRDNFTDKLKGRANVHHKDIVILYLLNIIKTNGLDINNPVLEEEAVFRIRAEYASNDSNSCICQPVNKDFVYPESHTREAIFNPEARKYSKFSLAIPKWKDHA